MVVKEIHSFVAILDIVIKSGKMYRSWSMMFILAPEWSTLKSWLDANFQQINFCTILNNNALDNKNI